MGAKHTPGPWVVAETRLGYDTIVRTQQGRGPVASILIAGYLRPVAMANARLVAAAPELLDALKTILVISDRKHDAWDRAYAAIAKATGESA